MKEAKHYTTLILALPFLDTMALLCLFLNVPDSFLGPLSLAYVSWKLRLALKLLKRPLLTLSMLGVYGLSFMIANVTDFWHMSCFAIISSALAGSHHWHLHTFVSLILCSMMRTSWHLLFKTYYLHSSPVEPHFIGPRKPQSELHELTHRFLFASVSYLNEYGTWSLVEALMLHFLEFMVIMSFVVQFFGTDDVIDLVDVFLATQSRKVPNLSGNTLRLGNDPSTSLVGHVELNGDSGAQLRRFRGLKSLRWQQPLWTFVALVRVLMKRINQVSPKEVDLMPYIRHIEDNLIAIEVDTPITSIKVNGCTWKNVHVDHDSKLLVVYGLESQVKYEIRLENEDLRFSEAVLVSTGGFQEDHGPGSDRKLPVYALSEAITKLQSRLREEKQTLRKQRRDQAKSLAVMRNETVTTQDKLIRSTKARERANDKSTNLQDSLKQLQQDIDEVEAATKALRLRKPEADSVFAIREKEWLVCKKEHDVLQGKLCDSKQEWMKEQQSLESELAQLEASLDETNVRVKKLESELAVLSCSHRQILDQFFAQRARERAGKLERRATLQQEFEESIRKLEQGSRASQTSLTPFHSTMNTFM